MREKYRGNILPISWDLANKLPAKSRVTQILHPHFADVSEVEIRECEQHMIPRMPTNDAELGFSQRMLYQIARQARLMEYIDKVRPYKTS